MKIGSGQIRTGIFLAVIASGAVFAIGHLMSGQAGPWQKLGWRSLIDGSAAKAIDRAVVRAIPQNARLNGIVDGALYGSIGDAGPLVRAGCEGWLYLAEETREIPNGEVFAADRVKLAERLAAVLEKRRIKLVLLAVPDKISFTRDFHCGLRIAQQSEQRIKIRQRFAEIPGMFVVDLTSSWPKPGFWRTDTHWDRTGARFAAEKTASAVKEILGEGRASIKLTGGAIHDRVGDLMRLANLEATARWFGPLPDKERNESAEIARAGGLLDEPAPASIILAGSSFSLSSGFLDYLQAALSREVLQKSSPGSGFSSSLLDLINERSNSLEQARVVVWEWPMRSLSQPLSEAEHSRLAPDAR